MINNPQNQISIMEKKKTIQLSALATGTVLLGSFAVQPANATPAFEDLGSGAELRSELLANNNPIAFMNNREVELKCGEGTCGEKSKDKKKDDKKAEATEDKATEAKCGEKGTQEDRDAAREKAEKRDAKKAKAADDKAGEHKCGEGKCGK